MNDKEYKEKWKDLGSIQVTMVEKFGKREEQIKTKVSFYFGESNE